VCCVCIYAHMENTVWVLRTVKISLNPDFQYLGFLGKRISPELNGLVRLGIEFFELRIEF
jgi:hypothetical protein